MSDGSRIKPRTAPPPVKERPRERTAPPQESPFDAPKNDAKAAKRGRKQPAVQLDAAIVTVSVPEPSVAIAWYWVEVDIHLPCGFDVTTRDGHGLEVVMEQLAYRKTFTGTGSLRTGLAPIAPIGTKGRIIARDTTTGETVEQPWTWGLRWGSGGGLWQLIKRLIWKGD